MKPFFAFLLLFVGTPLWAQKSTSEMLVRIERMQDSDDSRCLVVFGDGSYHAEKIHGKRTDVFEGALDSGRMSQVDGLINTDAMKQIQHEHLASARYIESPDIVSVDVNRGEDLQQMRFANKADRKPYAAQLEPLLQWFESIQKQPGARSSAKANRCLPEKTEVTRLVSAAATKPADAEPENPYHMKNLLLLYITERYEARANSFGEKKCVLVHKDGSAYAYKITVGYAHERDTLYELHTQLAPEQVAALKAAMEDPALIAAKEPEGYPRVYTREIDRTEVVAVRGTTVQHVRFAQATSTTTPHATPREGLQIVRGNDGSKETESLHRWSKDALEKREFQKVEHLSGECP